MMRLFFRFFVFFPLFLSNFSFADEYPTNVWALYPHGAMQYCMTNSFSSTKACTYDLMDLDETTEQYFPVKDDYYELKQLRDGEWKDHKNSPLPIGRIYISRTSEQCLAMSEFELPMSDTSFPSPKEGEPFDLTKYRCRNNCVFYAPAVTSSASEGNDRFIPDGGMCIAETDDDETVFHRVKPPEKDIYIRCPSGKGMYKQGTQPSEECLRKPDTPDIPDNPENPADPPVDPPVDNNPTDPGNGDDDDENQDGSSSGGGGGLAGGGSSGGGGDTNLPGNSNNGGSGSNNGANNGTDNGNVGSGSGSGNDDSGSGDAGNSGTDGGSTGGGNAGGGQNNDGDSGSGDAGGHYFPCPSGKGSYKKGTQPSPECLGESDGQGTISGGSCEADQPPQCKGDAIQCYIAKEQWRTACAATGEGNKIEGADCDKKFTCKGDAVQCHIARSQHEQMCRNRELENAGKGIENLDLGDGVTLGDKGMTAKDFTDKFVEKVDINKIIKDFDASGFLSARQCMAPKKFTILGRTVEIDFNYWCMFLTAISYFMVALGYWHGLRIFTGSVE